MICKCRILDLQFTFDGVDNLSMHSSYNESPPEQSPDAEEYFAKWDSGSEDMYEINPISDFRFIYNTLETVYKVTVYKVKSLIK